MTKSRYQHTISLNQEQEAMLEWLRVHKIGLMEVFIQGLNYIYSREQDNLDNGGGA